jgi:hypothetical protein
MMSRQSFQSWGLGVALPLVLLLSLQMLGADARRNNGVAKQNKEEPDFYSGK